MSVENYSIDLGKALVIREYADHEGNVGKTKRELAAELAWRPGLPLVASLGSRSIAGRAGVADCVAGRIGD